MVIYVVFNTMAMSGSPTNYKNLDSGHRLKEFGFIHYNSWAVWTSRL